MSEPRKITKAASTVGLSTLLSRLTGLVRDQLIAYFFGSSNATDAFFVAWRLPNLLRRLLAEGALTAAFIPIFTQTLSSEGLPAAAKLFRSIVTMAVFVLAFLTILGVILAPQLVMITAPGFLKDPDKFRLAVFLTRIVFPYIFFVGLVALVTGVLNSLNRFAVPALSPVLLNISMILAMCFLKPLNPPILSLALGAIIGGALQLAIQIPFLIKAGPFWGFIFDFKNPAIKKFLLLMGPASIGAAVYQISVFLNTLLASLLPDGSISWLYYADRLMQFPLGVFSIAIATAALPSLARQAAQNNFDQVAETSSFAINLQFLICLPATFGLIILAKPLVILLFERGQFTAVSTMGTVYALWGLVIGLPLLSAAQILVRIFYSFSNTKTPTKIAMVSLFLGVILGAILMWPLKHAGLALASSIAATINFFLLYRALKKQYPALKKGLVLNNFRPFLLTSLIMTVTLLAILAGLKYFFPTLTRFENALFSVLITTPLGILVYFSALKFIYPKLFALIKKSIQNIREAK